MHKACSLCMFFAQTALFLYQKEVKPAPSNYSFFSVG